MIEFIAKGDFSKANSFFERLLELGHFGFLDKYGRMGVEALRNFTPVDTGLLADSWRYEIEREDSNSVRLVWYNSDIEGGYNVALLVQYGHGTKNGGWVEGYDFINPAMEPIFLNILEEITKEVNA